MLKIKNITKVYDTNGFRQEALHQVSVNFRDNEFASILGQSGSGKTTLLNIIGGLDQYTSGDLIINGTSTKNYKDRDWDTYRNHKIGFIFQSYNLIPHQTILANVELALTLSGVSKKERKEKAIEALKKVGLENHIKKKPNQLSGGQMQRVAIARALVNDPDIILADEPTGALDSETAVQVMGIIKEISKEKLIIMVTHNPEIAEQYSTRIIKLKDGIIIDDTDPYTDEQANKDYEVDLKNSKTKENHKKPKGTRKYSGMGFKTALSLSLKNLMSKKGRTILTSVAGSIGIIGIAMILAISTGVNNYIDQVQQDTLSSFPIQIEKESTDMSALLESLTGAESSNGAGASVDKSNRNGVYGNPVMFKMMKSMLNAEVNTNNLKDFKTYLDKNHDELAQYSSAIHYGYDIKLNLYATDPNGKYAKADFGDLMNKVMEGGTMMSSITSLMEKSGGINVWQELVTDPNSDKISSLVTDQYELVHGKWPKEKNEILLVLNENNEISDITLYSLGLVDQDTMVNATLAAMMGKEDNGWEKYEGKSWTYDEICNIPLKMVLPTDYYQYDESLKLWVNVSENQALLDSIINKGMTLNIVGIIKPSEDATAPFLKSSLCYTNALTEYYMDEISKSEIIKQQKENKDNNIISGLPFVLTEEELTDKQKIEKFKEYVNGLTDNEKAKLYEQILALPKDDFIESTIDSLLKNYENKTAKDIVKDIKNQYADELGYSEELIDGMLSNYEKDELIELLKTTAKEMIIAQYKENASNTIKEIHGQPSAKEIEEMKKTIFAEMYKDINNLTEPQLSISKQQINFGFVAQNWSSKTGMSVENAMSVLMSMSPEDFSKAFETAVTETASQMYAQYSNMSSNSDKNSKVAKALENHLKQATNEDFVFFYNNHMPDKVSDKTMDEVLNSLGMADKTNPDFIYIYPVDFEMKENIAVMIDKYNNEVAEEDKIEYTDVAAMLMSSVSNIILAISVVLICFVSISLIVSSIMIGIITYISVLERTKEIGVLRAIGASKKDISHVFNAETAIVGFLAGFVGIATTLLLCIPFSLIARALTGIQSLTAMLPWYGYLLLLLSVGLTLIAGLLPSRMAANKDPVEALRSE